MAAPAGAGEAPPVAASPSTPAPVEDLPQIRWRRDLRVLVPSQPGRIEPAGEQFDLLRRFAGEQFLHIEWVPVERWDDLLPALLDGRGDLVAADLRITEPRKERVAFTLPLRTVRETLVVRAGDEIDGATDLRGRQVVLRERSSFWAVIDALRRDHPDIEVRLLPEDTPVQTLLEGVLEGEFDMAVVERAALESGGERWAALKAVPGFAGGDAIAWGVNPSAPVLLAALNAFLQREQMARPVRRRYTEDLPGIEARKVLRVLTRNNATTYFLWRGVQVGFEYELMKRFADSRKLQLEMIVAPSRERLLPMLLEGQGDVVAAALTVTDARRRMGVEFSRPYNEVSEILVARARDWSVRRPTDLAGRRVAVRPSSSYRETLERLRGQGVDLAIQDVPEDMETEEIIARVASGEYDLTVSDSHILDVELAWRDDVRAGPVLNGPVHHGWAVRAADRELLAALDGFLEKEYRGLDYNVIYERYFRSPYRIRSHVAAREEPAKKGRLSPYDDMVRRHARAHGFDWRMVVAQMYQESRFDPKAKSFAGAGGLLQVLPDTAARYGISDLSDPEQGLEAGMRYLDWLHGRFSPELSVKDRMWFALAAYNAGLGHVIDARALARELDLDPDRWFGNVERAMLLLSRRKYHRKARHGYVRGGQPVIYVREIRDRYNAYVELVRR